MFLRFSFRGSVIAKIVGNNVLENQKFDNEVPMWVFEETVNGRKLTEILNTEHENVKYLPGHKLPENVVSTGLNFYNICEVKLSINLVCLWERGCP